MIKDSGARRRFKTGAVRDVSKGRGRCDLLPLDIIAHEFHYPVLEQIDLYIWGGDVFHLWNALTRFRGNVGWDVPTMLLEAAKQYEAGANKYGDRNWQLGQPLHVFIDSAVRHYLKWERKDNDEPHDRAFLFNILGAIWTHTNKPELIDLPFKGNEQASL